MSIDGYFERRYDRENYNCLAFSGDVWFDLTGIDIRKRLKGLSGAVRDRQVTRDHVSAFQPIDKPVSPCLVLMQRARSAPHVGIYLRGRVLHIQESGVEYQPLDVACRGFTSVRFYTCNK